MLRRRFNPIVVRSGLFMAALFLTTIGPVWSCGPLFVDSVFDIGDNAVLDAPSASFSFELKLLLKRQKYNGPKSIVPSKDRRKQNTIAGISDLNKALKGQKFSDFKKETLILSYLRLRNEIEQFDNSYSKKVCYFSNVPEGLPKDFEDYLKASVLYRTNRVAEAQVIWQGILDRKQEGVRYRSTWAAYMLGKSSVSDSPKKAIKYYQRVRALARQTAIYPDSLALAAASIGWEAHCELKLKNYGSALAAYLRHHMSGDPSALHSLRMTIARALESGTTKDLEILAKDSLKRDLVTAYVLSRVESEPGYGMDSKLALKWLKAVEQSPVKAQYADRVAWVFYRMGLFGDAQRWLNKAPTNGTLRQWLQAKLYLRDARIDEALVLLSKLTRAFPKAEVWYSSEFPQNSYSTDGFSPKAQVYAELGLLKLGRCEYIEALDALLRANYWEDAAYLAERVLTVTELVTYVNQNWRVGKAGEGFRHLLARRLVRHGRFAEARLYFPKKLRNSFDRYRLGLKKGADRNLSRLERAGQLWQAAIIARKQGMELMGTELEPDWFVHGGGYTGYSRAHLRKKAKSFSLTKAHAAEFERVENHTLTINKRFHYRYIAADLGWRSTLLMPNNSVQTARMLYKSGGWLKDLNPKAANRFYQALVWRCPETELGQVAKKRRWFPRKMD
jgi:tetratricopeptide (TPR) repeat protein